MTVISEIHEIPHPLGITPEEGGVTIANPPGLNADYNIAGVEFLSAASDDFPYQRQLAKQVKEQIDQSTNPGDNSLDGLWIRSQTDWSYGAGQEFMEPISTDIVSRQFRDSAGVDVFTNPGTAYPLYVADWEIPLPVSGAVPVIVRTPLGFIVASGSTVKRYESESLTGTLTAAGTVTSLAVAGDQVLIGSVNNVERAPLSGAFTATSTWTLTGTPYIWFVKSRALICVGDKVYEKPGTIFGAAAPIGAALYDFKDSSLTVTGVTTTPRSILLSTKGNSGSVIYALTLDDAGTLPSTTAPISIAEFPSNEEIIDIESYLGTYVGIATSQGFRVATIQSNGSITYGPLLDSPSVMSDGQNVISSYDRFLHYPTYDAGDGRSGLVKVDLSTLGEDGRAAWSNWVRLPAGNTAFCIGGFATDQRTAVLLVNGDNGVFTTSEFNYESSSWLETSAIRFGTLEPKMFDSIRLTMAGTDGTLRVDAIDPQGTSALVGVTSPLMGTEPVFKIKPRKTQSSVAFKFTFTPVGGNMSALNAWTTRAYPAVANRGELVQIPLLNFDFEYDSSDVMYGYEGRAWERYKALRDRFAQGTSMLIKELNSGASYIALPEDLQFIQVAPGNRYSGFGGIIQVVLRTLP